MRPSVSQKSFSLREALVSFLALWLLWAVARWPAFVHPFWLADDFSMWDMTTARITDGGAAQGRLLNGLWYSLYFLFPPPDHLAGSVVLRSLGGALHSGASLLLLTWLNRFVGRPGAWGAVLLFHLWAFNSEATIWFAGSTYALAALLSMGGVALIAGDRTGRRPVLCALGGLLVAAAIHSNQAPAMAGISFWLLVSTFRLLGPGLSGRRWLMEGLWLGGAYLVGGALSLWVMHVYDGSRGAGSVIFGEKVTQLGHIWERLWFFPGIYPLALQLAHAFFLGLALASWAWASIRRWLDLRESLALLGLFLALAVLPFAANLAVPDNAFPVRVLYAGTLLWVAMAAWLFRFALRAPLIGWVCGGLLVSILLWNLVLGAREAAEFSEVYRRDLAALRELEQFAAEHGTDEVLFMDWSNSAPWQSNPYDLDLHYGDSVKSPVFQKIYWSYRFVDYYSDSLENTRWWPAEPGEGTRWDHLREKYASHARALPRENWIEFVHMEEEDLILVVPR